MHLWAPGRCHSLTLKTVNMLQGKRDSADIIKVPKWFRLGDEFWIFWTGIVQPHEPFAKGRNGRKTGRPAGPGLLARRWSDLVETVRMK